MPKKQDTIQSRLTFDAAGNWRLSSAPIVPAASVGRSRTATRARKTTQRKKTAPYSDASPIASSSSSSPAATLTTAVQATSAVISTSQSSDEFATAIAPLSPTNIQAATSEPLESAAITPNPQSETPSLDAASQPTPASGILSPRSQRRAYRKAYQQNVRNASAAAFELLLNHLSDNYPTAIWEYAALDPAPKVYRLATAAYHLITQLQHQLWPDTFTAHSSFNNLSEKSDNGNANLTRKPIAEEPPSGRTPSGLISQAKTNKGRDKSYDAVEKLIEVLDSDLRPKNTKIKGLPDQKAWAPAMVMIQRLERDLREEGMAFEGEMGVVMGGQMGKGKGVGSDMVRNGEVYLPFLGV